MRSLSPKLKLRLPPGLKGILSSAQNIDKLGGEVSMMADGEENISTVQAYKANIASIEDKMDVKFMSVYQQYVCLHGEEAQ